MIKNIFRIEEILDCYVDFSIMNINPIKWRKINWLMAISLISGLYTCLLFPHAIIKFHSAWYFSTCIVVGYIIWQSIMLIVSKEISRVRSHTILVWCMFFLMFLSGVFTFIDVQMEKSHIFPYMITFGANIILFFAIRHNNRIYKKKDIAENL